MRVLVLLAALTTPAFAATITPPKPPAKPTPPAVSLQDSRKPEPAREPVLFDSIRRLLGPEKSAPKGGAGPGIG
jgi:hypothetical protein